MSYPESLDAFADGEDVFEANAGMGWTTRYPHSVREAISWGGGVWALAVSRAIDAGLRDANELTNLAFWMHVPELGGKNIPAGHPRFNDWAALWNFLRTGVLGLLQERLAPPPKKPSGGNAPGSAVCKVVGQVVVCGTCRADGSNRPTADLPTMTVPVRPEIRYNKKRQLRLRPDAEAAWSKLVAAARADGIAAPYLTIRSALRNYDVQARLWRNRLTGKFREMGCREPELSCIYRAADRTNKALKRLPAPHPRSAWLGRFRSELRKSGCRTNCPDGGSDPPARAVSRLAKGTARPGRSKHQSGRAVDIHLGSGISLRNASRQRRTAAFRWLVCNAARFGFVPYVAEPWHWEFNG